VTEIINIVQYTQCLLEFIKPFL